jgi:hypothetical protein
MLRVNAFRANPTLTARSYRQEGAPALQANASQGLPMAALASKRLSA